MIGAFDGRVFTPESGKHRFSYGNCFYASQTYSDVPAADGRRVQIAWGRGEAPGMPLNQMMRLPVELTLRKTGEGRRMFAKPVREIERLREARLAWNDVTVSAGSDPVGEVEGELLHVRATLRPQGTTKCGLVVHGTEIAWDATTGTLSCLDKTASLLPTDGSLRLELLVDRTSIEIFASEGQVYLPMAVAGPQGNKSLQVLATGGPVKVESLEIHRLRSAWP